jgi:hypothetical protein
MPSLTLIQEQEAIFIKLLSRSFSVVFSPLNTIGRKLRISSTIFPIEKMTSITSNILSSSFRDPSGFLFFDNNTLFRSVSRRYQQHYDHLIQSGLYNKLIEENLLIPHVEVNPETIEHYPGNIEDIYKIIKPEHVPFISYPYEWCFSQLKDAALTTLKIQNHAFDHGMVLKDASA